MIELELSPLTTAEDWRETIYVSDGETGEPIDLSGAAIKMAVKRHGERTPILTGSTDDGKITVPDLGSFTFAFPVSTRSAMHRGSYEIGITITNMGEVFQLSIGTISVIDGVVRP